MRSENKERLRISVPLPGRRGVGLALLVLALAVVCFVVRKGVVVEEEIVAPESPVFSKTVQEAVAKLKTSHTKGVPDDTQAAKPKAPVSPTSRDIAIMNFISLDMKSVSTAALANSVYIHWSEKHGRFQKTPFGKVMRVDSRSTKSADVYVYCSSKKEQFEMVSINDRGKIEAGIPKGWGIALSTLDHNIYVYWCKKCGKAHKTVWKLDTKKKGKLDQSHVHGKVFSQQEGMTAKKRDGGRLGNPNRAATGPDVTIPYQEMQGAKRISKRVFSNREWVGLTTEKLKSIFGTPPELKGKTELSGIYDYSNVLGPVFYLVNGKVRYWCLGGDCSLRTSKGIGPGSHVSDIIKAYGAWKEQVEVEQWFAGDKENVLYYHPKYKKYKLNYPKEGLIIILNKEKKAELIYAGDIESFLK